MACQTFGSTPGDSPVNSAERHFSAEQQSTCGRMWLWVVLAAVLAYAGYVAYMHGFRREGTPWELCLPSTPRPGAR